jgi:DNA primase
MTLATVITATARSPMTTPMTTSWRWSPSSLGDPPTGGAGSFRAEWAETLQRIPELYICYDRDEAGRTGANKVGRLLPQAKLIVLPAEVEEGGDVTEFFVRLGRTREDFMKLLTDAEPVPPPQEPVIQVDQPRHHRSAVDARLLEKIGRIKRTLTIAETIARFVQLHVRGDHLVGLCPFHHDHTPSLVVYPATDTFHCYGCGKHGDVIDFVQAHEHLTFTQTLDALESVRRYYDREHQANN